MANYKRTDVGVEVGAEVAVVRGGHSAEAQKPNSTFANTAASSASPQKLAARRASSIPSTTMTLPATSATLSGEWSPPSEQRAEFNI